jgi:hypothetical protein
MSLSTFSRLAVTRIIGALAVVFLLAAEFAVVRADLPPEISRMFPLDLNGFHQVRAAQPTTQPNNGAVVAGDYPKYSLPTLGADAEYVSPDGEKLRIELLKFGGDSAAYSWFTKRLKRRRDEGQKGTSPLDGICTASAMSSSQSLVCFKGANFVTVASENGKNSDRVKALARAFAETLDPGEGEIPVLVKHLPNSDTAQRDAVYAVSQGPLLAAIPDQPILKELNFDGGTEAVTANYGQSQLVIAEFTTPQFSVENDQRIWLKIAELKNAGQPGPTAYRRVGNYSVFVFNAPDEKTANELVDQVKYEQVVQWLGDDPHLAERLQRYFSQTTAGVLLAVLKTSGLSLLVCLGAGAVLGTLLFRHRRAQQAAFYSDAGGATRLNLDEMTGASNSQRLLGPGKQTESDS